MKFERAIVQEKVGGLFWKDLLVFKSIETAKEFVADEKTPEVYRVIWRTDEVIEL